MLKTSNYSLNKPEGSDVVDISVLNTNFDTIDATMKTLDTKSATYAVTSGSANTYTATISGITSYFAGLRVCVQINTTSTGASTLNINGLGAKTILDSLGNAISNGGLKANIPYQLCYNGSSFIVLGKGGGGNAIASQILLGKTATVDSGQITGTLDLTNLTSGNIKSGVTINGVSGSSTVVDTADANAGGGDILSGKFAYNNGSKVTGIIPIRNSGNDLHQIYIGANGTNLFFEPPTGNYFNGASVYATYNEVANAIGLTSDKLVSGQNILGVNGSVTIESLGGRQFASGTATYTYGNALTIPMPFTPSVIIFTDSAMEGGFVWNSTFSNENYFLWGRTSSQGGWEASVIHINNSISIPNNLVTGTSTIAWYAWA